MVMTQNKQKILIIEDDAFLGSVLMQKLAAADYETRLAGDGVSGLAEIRSWKPDLVLLDIILPKMNGYEVLEEKFKDKDIVNIPVVVISNSGQPVEINRALSLGVKDYLVKAQFDPEEVMVKVRTQLGKGGADAVVSVGGESATPLTGALKGKKVLWVEDDTFLSDLIARKLSTQECTMAHAIDGEEALALAASEHPDVILLDILLPGVDGYEVLKRLKANPQTKSIPVILLSNLGQSDDVEKGKTLGAARFLIKATVTLDEIVAEIKSVLT
ncbi:MAG: response regulator [bacterium]|nr:response regulator [bacterium]